MKLKTKYITSVGVIDPDSKMPVDVAIYKLETGGMVGIDESFLIEEDDEPVYSPFDKNVELEIQ